MISRTALAALGLATLFLGGVVGGVLANALLRPAQAEAPLSVSPGNRAPAGDPALQAALLAAVEDLAREVRRLASAPRGDDRRAVGETPPTPASDEDLVAALDRLSAALESSPGRAFPGGIGITPLIHPTGGKRVDSLSAIADRDWEEVSREYRFSTYQQVLSGFGPPDEVTGDGTWLYYLGEGDAQRALTFNFVDGYLVSIYN